MRLKNDETSAPVMKSSDRPDIFFTEMFAATAVESSVSSASSPSSLPLSVSSFDSSEASFTSLMLSTSPQ